MKKILAYIFFLPIFVVTLTLTNVLLAPILQWIVNLFNRFVDFASTYLGWESIGYLGENILQPALITAVCVYVALAAATSVFPKNTDLKIPVLFCSIILLIQSIASLVLVESAIDLLADLGSEVEDAEFSRSDFYIKAFAHFCGYVGAVYFLFETKEKRLVNNSFKKLDH